VEVCGIANTNELFHVGRNVDADRGYEMGLVNEVVTPQEIEKRSVELAAEIGANAPLSLEGNKRVLRTLRAATTALDPEAERELVELRESCFFSDDFREGIRAFAEKRPPRWTDS
jgi:enoyl-CoA hydratase/carnithine racemase